MRRGGKGPAFKEVENLHCVVDMEGIKDGIKELWLLQLPKQVRAERSLQACSAVFFLSADEGHPS